MKKFEEYLEEAIANKQVNVSLNTDKRELSFQLRGLFPTTLINAMGKALKGNKFTIADDEFTIYL
jgi:hypothetical protein